MSEYVGLHDNGKSTVEGFQNIWSTLLSSGVSLINTPTSWQVTQRGAGANMSIDIAAGNGLIAGTLFPYPCWSTATLNQSVTTADPSNPRHDIVVAYIDMSVPSTAVNNNLGALKFKVVAGTAAVSPSDPNSSAIQLSVGAGNPWIYLARISIPTSGTPVVNAWITDLRQPISFKGRLWGGSSNTNGHVVPNVADDTMALLGAPQTWTGSNIFGSGTNIGGAWSSWTPTLTNWAVGTGGSAGTIANYIQIGKTVHFRIRSVLGTSGFSIGVGAISFTLPVTANAELAASASEGYIIGQAKLLDATIQAYEGRVQVLAGDPTQAFLIAQNTSGTYSTQAAANNAVPFAWGAGDMFIATGWYEAA